ncbi:MAG: HD domain-containing phosphohydrolase [Nitrospirota bacterium]
MKYPRRSPLKNPLKSLRIKSVLTLLFFFFLASALGAKLLVDFQTRQLLKQADKEAGSLAGMVSDDIMEAMLKGSPSEAWRALDKAGKDGNKAWLTDYSGMIIASSIPEDVGKRSADLFEIKHGGISDILKKGPRAGTGGDYILSRTVAIRKKPACGGCHYKSPDVLGRLTVGISYSKTLTELSALKRWLVLGATILGAILALAALLFLTRIVIKPVRRMTNAIQGDLDEKVKKLTSLSDISRSMNIIHKLDDLLRMVIHSAVRELDADSGSVMLLEKGVDELFIHTGRGLSLEAHRKNRFRLGEGVAGWAAQNRSPVMIDDVQEDPRFAAGRGFSKHDSMLCVPLIGASSELLGVINIERGPTRPSFRRSEMEYLLAISGQASVAIENVALIQNLEKSYYDTISALAQAVEAKDPYTLGHSDRVTQYAIAIGEEMGLPPEDIAVLRYGATLHDVGKIGIDEAVLNKPGKLTREEFLHMKEHPEIGESIVRGVDFLQKVRPIIRHHQERHDGLGYPDGLKGDEIPLMVAIVSVADVFDALTSDRPYRKAKSTPEAIRMIKEESGQFNPSVVESFLKIFAEEEAPVCVRTAS